MAAASSTSDVRIYMTSPLWIKCSFRQRYTMTNVVLCEYEVVYVYICIHIIEVLNLQV